MPSRRAFRLNGLDDTLRNLRAVGSEVATKAGASGLRQAANILKDAWKDAAPKGEQTTKRTWRNKDGSQGEADYGRLRDNIKVKKRRSVKAHTISFVVTTGRAFWGIFSEFGTEHEQARPWARPALDRTADKVFDAIANELKKGLDRVLRRARK